jgi:hypothetical protein
MEYRHGKKDDFPQRLLQEGRCGVVIADAHIDDKIVSDIVLAGRSRRRGRGRENGS